MTLSPKEIWIDQHPKVVAITKAKTKYSEDISELERTITAGLFAIQRLMIASDVLTEKMYDLEATFPSKHEKFLRKATGSDSEGWFYTHKANVELVKDLAISKCQEVLDAKKTLEKLEGKPPWAKYWEIRQEAEKEYEQLQSTITKESDAKPNE